MKAPGSSKNTAWIAFVLLSISLLLVRLPLFDYLGYEFSAAIALVLPWIIGFNTIRILRRSFPLRAEVDPRSYRGTMLQIFREGMFINGSLMLERCFSGSGACGISCPRLAAPLAALIAPPLGAG